MEYYSSETCFMEELFLVKDMENNIQDLNNLDSCFTTTISSSNANYCFEDYSNLPIHNNIQTLSFPEEYYPSLDTNQTVVQEGYSINYADQYYYNDNSKADGSIVVDTGAPCKDEPVPAEMPIFNIEDERKNKMKIRMNGQPSKNLMAERRRRKRLNDRLSMLRSVVPKISKMDRTSILGDTIDYMKELLERINNLQEEMDDGGLMTIFNDAKPNESTLMEVERGNGDTRIKICCAMKPGLLLSTMNTLEELGLEIQQCVISCFSDFTMQASCSQELKTIDAEDIKQALLRKAGYGGREAAMSVTSTFVKKF